MFDKIKDMYELRKQAQEMQRTLAGEKVIGMSRDGSFRVTINGNQEVLSVDIAEDANLERERLQSNAKEAFSDSLTKIKEILAKKMQGMM